MTHPQARAPTGSAGSAFRRAKIKTLKFIARELAAERLPRRAGARGADAAHATLTALHGIGPWTADIYLLFCLATPMPGPPATSRSRKPSGSGLV